LKSGNQQYFEAFVKMYQKKIYDFIYRMVHNKSCAEDLTQEVFIKIYRNIYRLNSVYSFKTWVYKIAYTTTVSYLRRNRSTEVDIETEEMASDKDYIGDFETTHTVLKAIQTLKHDCRAIFFLRIMEDLTFDQIADTLGMTVGSVKQKFYSNRKILINMLTDSFKEV
jgi:RNA polymerase sigma-70 factor (ECF subfamily)